MDYIIKIIATTPPAILCAGGIILFLNNYNAAGFLCVMLGFLGHMAWVTAKRI